MQDRHWMTCLPPPATAEIVKRLAAPKYLALRLHRRWPLHCKWWHPHQVAAPLKSKRQRNWPKISKYSINIVRRCKTCLQNHVKMQSWHGSWDVSQFHALFQVNSLSESEDMICFLPLGTCIIASNCKAPSQWLDFSHDVMAALYTTTLPSSFFLSSMQRIWRVRVGWYIDGIFSLYRYTYYIYILIIQFSKS